MPQGLPHVNTPGLFAASSGGQSFWEICRYQAHFQELGAIRAVSVPIKKILSANLGKRVGHGFTLPVA